MRKVWTDIDWEDYLYWQGHDKKIVKRINDLLKDIERNGNAGIGKPEPLRHEFQGLWSRRIDDCHRLVYQLGASEVTIVSCRLHYR